MDSTRSESSLAIGFDLRPVGFVRNEIAEPSLGVRSGDLDGQLCIERARDEQKLISELVIDPDLVGILDGIDDFSHLLVLYWAHRISPESRSLCKVHPMGRREFPLVGIFATCSPARPNPILIKAVPLLERKKNVLHVQGLDAVNGSPILDIKPYLPAYYSVKGVRLSPWMEQIVHEFR